MICQDRAMSVIDIIERSVETTAIDGLLRITTRQVIDERGTVREWDVLAS
jgi:hypothetical protein